MKFSSWRLFQRKDHCELHGAGRDSANRTLLLMVLGGFAVIVWHLLVYGPSSHATPSAGLAEPLWLQLGRELWDLVFSRHGIVAELWDVTPYFLIGVLLAGYLRTYKFALKLQASLRRYGAASVVVASFVGIVSPLCACGTLTTAVSLLFAGLPLAPVMAILITSPLMSPSTYLLTLNDLGPEWTVIRTAAAFLMGIFAGYVTHLLCVRGFDKSGVFIDGAVIRGDFHDENYPDARLRCNCREKFGNRVAARTGNMFLIFLAKSSEMLWAVGKFIVVGVIIGSIVERYMPYEWIYRFFSNEDPLNIVWVTLCSVPIFLHQISASSIMVHIKNSLPGTLDGGAGLAFMIGGPVTAIPTMILFWTMFKKRFFFLYIFVCLVGTVLIATAFQQLVFVPGVDTGNQLFQGVSRLAGGRSLVVNKETSQVRIALDQAGKAVVATYSNDVSGHGAVVFDGSFARFTHAGERGYDNEKYLANIATMLEQGADLPQKGAVFMYLVDDATGEVPVFISQVASILRQARFTVTVARRKDLPVLNAKDFAGHGQIWLFMANDGPKAAFLPEEVALLTSMVTDGRGMLLAVAPPSAGADAPVAANQVAAGFGARFTGMVTQAEVIPVAVGANFFSRAAVVLGKVLKLVHKA